jgi:hypothetical protein
MRGHQRPGSSEKGRSNSSRRLPKLISWVITVALAAVIGDWAAQGSHSLAAQGLCAIRYLTAPATSYPASSRWSAYGVTQLTVILGKTLTIQPAGQQLTDEWFGASLNGPRLCNYQVDFDADLSAPLYPKWASSLGYGYSAGAAGQVSNDVPDGTTVQFDPPFGGLRTVELPGGVNAPGHNPRTYAFVRPGHYCHWQLTVNGIDMTTSVDGRRYGTVRLTGPGSGDIILRIWDARLSVKNVRISKLRP